MAWIVMLGLLMGPVLNELIDRLPRRQSILARPSCPVCGHRYSWRLLLPLGAWLSSDRRCRECNARPSRRSQVVEVAMPLIAAGLWLRSGTSIDVLIHLVIAAYFVAIVAIDFEHRLVLNRMTGAGLLFALALAAFGFGPSLSAAITGTVIGFLFLWIPALLMPGLGMGDVKLAAVIGALVGFPAVLTALTLGVVVGGVAAAVLLISRRIQRRGTIAYAPYLVVGVALVLLGVMS